MKNIYATIWLAGSFSILAACAPITPLPGGMPPSLPSPPSAGGAPSMPSGTPPSLPGGSPSLPGGQPGGQPSGQSGSESGEQPSSDGSEGLPGGGMPGGQPSGMPGGSDPNSDSDGEAPEPTWDVEQGGSSGAEGEKANLVVKAAQAALPAAMTAGIPPTKSPAHQAAQMRRVRMLRETRPLPVGLPVHQVVMTNWKVL